MTPPVVRKGAEFIPPAKLMQRKLDDAKERLPKSYGGKPVDDSVRRARSRSLVSLTTPERLLF